MWSRRLCYLATAEGVRLFGAGQQLPQLHFRILSSAAAKGRRSSPHASMKARVIEYLLVNYSELNIGRCFRPSEWPLFGALEKQPEPFQAEKSLLPKAIRRCDWSMAT